MVALEVKGKQPKQRQQMLSCILSRKLRSELPSRPGLKLGSFQTLDGLFGH